jgi:hypothetical protein
MAMSSKKRTWLWIIFGVLICLALGVIGLFAAGAYMVSRHVRTELVGRVSAQEELIRQRDRFAGQKPLIELTGDARDHQVIVHRNPESARTELQTMRVLVYDRHEGRLVHVDLPFWLLRLVPSGRIGNVSGRNSGFSFESSRLTVDDLERHGPGLILDLNDEEDAQVLIWTE